MRTRLRAWEDAQNAALGFPPLFSSSSSSSFSSSSSEEKKVEVPDTDIDETEVDDELPDEKTRAASRTVRGSVL